MIADQVTATDAEVGPRSGDAPAGHVPGEVGVWLVIFGEMTVFAILFSIYLIHRTQNLALYRAEQQGLVSGLGFGNTLLLLTSSLLVAAGVHAVRRGAHRATTPLFLGALAGGAAFLGLKVLEYRTEIGRGFLFDTNQFATDYYMLTGVHAFHVILGMLAVTVVLVKARRPRPTAGAMIVIEGGSCYWHMVDLLWIVLFPLVYLVR